MPGEWNTSSPPTRAGVYFNFTQALQQAITGGTIGTAAVIGTADWGPLSVQEQTGLGTYENDYSKSTNGTLREAALGALDGFDGGGAARVLSLRIAGSSKKMANVTIKDTAGTPANALKLIAKYHGARANSWSVSVQTNAITAANKDLILYENGVELARWENVKEGKNDAFVTAINASNSEYLTAELSGSAGRVVANIVGVIAGAGGLTEGDSGLSTLLADYSAALVTLGDSEFDTIAIANLLDKEILDVFVIWLKERNELGKRCFGVIGGKETETLTEAKSRLTATETPPGDGTGYSEGKNTDGSYTYGHAALNLINLGATDVKNLETNVVTSTAKLAPRYAGALARIGWSRSMYNVRWTGYQVVNPLSPANYTVAGNGGVVCMANDTTQRIAFDNSVTGLLVANSSDRPEAFKDSRNVAIAHFIENTLTRVAKDVYGGSLPNDDTGRRDLCGSFLKFLEGVEVAGGLASGSSVVELDDSYVQSGDAVFLRYGVEFQGIVKRIFSTVRVKSS